MDASNTDAAEPSDPRGKKIQNEIVANGVRPHVLKEKHLVLKEGFPVGFGGHLKLGKPLI